MAPLAQSPRSPGTLTLMFSTYHALLRSVWSIKFNAGVEEKRRMDGKEFGRKRRREVSGESAGRTRDAVGTNSSNRGILPTKQSCISITSPRRDFLCELITTHIGSPSARYSLSFPCKVVKSRDTLRDILYSTLLTRNSQ